MIANNTIITDFLVNNMQMTADVAFWVEIVVVAAVYLGVFAILGLFLVWMERRVAAFFQQRLGPNRRGPAGLLQTVADALKLVSKEITGTERRDKFLYTIAPYFVIVTSLMALAVLPFSAELQAYDVNIGVFFITSVSSVAVIGIFLAGWASNNKFSLLGGMRSGIQMISYELSTGMVVVAVAVLTGTLQLSGIIDYQQEHGWLIWSGHIPAIIGFMVFMIAGTAESNRTPFDLVEAESELGSGYHSEYSGMNFAYYFLAEFVNMFIISSMAVVLFFGGWLSPFGITEGIPYVGAIWFIIKVMGMVFLMMWFRWTFPRFRIDQLLTLEWKYLIPISMVNIVFMALLVWLGLTF